HRAVHRDRRPGHRDHPAHRRAAALAALGGLPRADPRRGRRQPGRPAVPGTGPAARPGGGLDQPARPGRPGLAGVQPGRLGDRGGRRARRAARVRRLRAARPPDPPAAMSDHRGLPVPDGLDGLRADAALARLFGFSRTTAAGLVEAGDALLDGATLAKSDRVRAGAWLEVTLPAPPAPPTTDPTPVEGLTVLYAD